MELNYKEFGEGEPIIILHGLFGALDNWQTIAKQLAEDYWVFIVDQRNHGRSPHTEDMNYQLMAEDLKEFMDQHWLPKAHIIGHSMGGKTAMTFALEYPDMVDKLIVVDISPEQNKAGHHQIFEAILSMDVGKIENRKEAEAILEKDIKEEGVRLFLLKNLTRNKSGGYKWKMNLNTIHQEYQNILAKVEASIPFDGDTLFIKGALSDYIKPGQEDEILKVFTNSKIHTIENAGHWVHADAPNKLLDEVKAFLTK